jgi:hypothetical protein
MHVLAKFAPQNKSCGVWTDGESLTVLEAYPSACKNSSVINDLRSNYAPLGHGDKEAALTCALIASLYAKKRDMLLAPDQDISTREGWIWVPRDSFQQIGRSALIDRVP